MSTVSRSFASTLWKKTFASECFHCDTHCEVVLKRLRGRQDLCDVVLIVGDSGKRISAHRLILISFSDYFSALLSGSMRESQEREIIFHEVVGDELEELVKFCYTGSLELRGDTIESLITTANYLQLQDITEGCCEFLQRHLHPSNCFAIGFLAEQLNLQVLLQNAQKMSFENGKELSEMTNVAPTSKRTFGIKTNTPEHFRCETHYESVLKCLRSRQDLCDVVLIVGDSGKRISAHRLLLIACNDYFSTLLSGPLRESDHQQEITLNEVDGDALENLVNFCYTGKLEFRVNSIEALLTTANVLQFNEVFEPGCDFFIRRLQPSNCLDAAFFAERLNKRLDIEAVFNSAWNIICKHFEEVSNHPKFFLLTAKHLSELIASDDLDVPSEEFVFRVLKKWIEYEPDNRSKHFPELLSRVRLPLLPPTFLTEMVEPLCNTTESQKLVLNAHKFHQMPSKELSTQLRKGFRNLLFIYGRKTTHQNIRNMNLEIAGCNLRTRKWTIWNTPIEFRRQVAAALMDDNVILVGGFYKGSAGTIAISLNLSTMTSTEMAPLSTRRCDHVLAVLNGSIYAIGGHDGHQILNSVERWEPTSRKWSYVAAMKDSRRSSSVAVLNNHLYVSGGMNGEGVLASMECYNPDENIWRSTATPKWKRSSHCLAAHNGYLFAIGGNSSRNIPIERYDPRTDTWTKISSFMRITINGYTRGTSLGPDIFIYNDCNIWKIYSDGSCDNFNLHILHVPGETFINFDCRELVTIPYGVSLPVSSIKNKER